MYRQWRSQGGGGEEGGGYVYVCELYLPTVDLSGFYMKDDNRIQ